MSIDNIKYDIDLLIELSNMMSALKRQTVRLSVVAPTSSEDDMKGEVTLKPEHTKIKEAIIAGLMVLYEDRFKLMKTTLDNLEKMNIGTEKAKEILDEVVTNYGTND